MPVFAMKSGTPQALYKLFLPYLQSPGLDLRPAKSPQPPGAQWISQKLIQSWKQVVTGHQEGQS